MHLYQSIQVFKLIQQVHVPLEKKPVFSILLDSECPIKINQTCGPQISHQIGTLKCWFFCRKENQRTRRKTIEARTPQQQSQPTYDAGSGNGTRT